LSSGTPDRPQHRLGGQRRDEPAGIVSDGGVANADLVRSVATTIYSGGTLSGGAIIAGGSATLSGGTPATRWSAAAA
jgi:hypothetical protein